MSVAQTVMISVLSSTVTAGIITFIVVEFFKRFIEHEFRRKDVEFGKQIELEFAVRSNIVETRLGVFPEISEVVYRLRNLAHDALTINNPFTWGKSQFSDCCYHLTENLYKYRIFLPVGTFTKLHKLKRTAQDFLVRTDSMDRPENLSDSSHFSDDTLAYLKNLSSALDELSDDIIGELKKHVETSFQDRR